MIPHTYEIYSSPSKKIFCLIKIKLYNFNYNFKYFFKKIYKNTKKIDIGVQ